MKIEEIIKLLNAELLCGENHLTHEVEYAFASDLMSDVLTLDTEDPILITGLINTQCLRTAEMADIKCIIFARDKSVQQDMIKLAHELDLIIIRCKYSVFKTSGLLFESGIKGIY